VSSGQQVILEISLSSQSLALVLTTKPEQPRLKTLERKTQNNQT